MQRAARSAVTWAAGAAPVRFFRAALPVLAADKAALLELRRRTGLPFPHCRDALLRCGGDLGQAEAWLQEQARRQGWSRAGAVQGRRAQQGLLGLLREGTAAVMVEVNCETDFVARTAEFQRVVELAALGAMAHCRAAPATCAEHRLGAEELAQLRTGPGGELLSDSIAMAIGKLGEKVALRRAAWLRAPEEDGYVATYAHGWLPAKAPVAMGTYGAVVAFRVQEPRQAEATLEEVGRKVAQHVVGLAPRALGTPQDRPRGEGEEEERLLAQGFLLAPGLTVGQFLGARGALAVSAFLRFRCGEPGEGQGGSAPPGG